VFVSRPLDLSPEQVRSLRIVERQLRRLLFEPLTVESRDYPLDDPMREVYALARRCSGGIIMGFKQYEILSGTRKAGTRSEFRIQGNSVLISSPWNHIEAGVLFGLELPLIVFREEAVEGGIFEGGSSRTFVHPMPHPTMNRRQREYLRTALLKWADQVLQTYYDFSSPPNNALQPASRPRKGQLKSRNRKPSARG